MLDTEYATVAVVAIALAVVTPLAAGGAVPVAQDEQGVHVRNISAESVTLRNVTATDVVVRELTVRQLGQRENVTLRNVSVPRVVVERAQLAGIRVSNVTIRSDDLLSEFGIPYVRGANVTNKSVSRISLTNRTLDGVVVQNLTVANASGLNLSVGANATGDVSVTRSSAELVVGNASVDIVRSFRASFGNATATNETATNATATNATATTTASA